MLFPFRGRHLYPVKYLDFRLSLTIVEDPVILVTSHCKTLGLSALGRRSRTFCKRAITMMLARTISGHLLPPQGIYTGTTERCHPPHYSFPEDWNVTQTSSHWSNTESMHKYLQEVTPWRLYLPRLHRVVLQRAGIFSEVRSSFAIDALEIVSTEVASRCSSEGWQIPPKSSHWSNTDSILEYLQEVVISCVQSERGDRRLDEDHKTISMLDTYKAHTETCSQTAMGDANIDIQLFISIYQFIRNYYIQLYCLIELALYLFNKTKHIRILCINDPFIHHAQ